LSPQKGQTYLIELARRLKTEGVKFRLLIAGKGELEQQLQQYAQALEVKEEIQFLGFQENIKGFMGNIDIFVLSSSFEGFGYALVEAMAAQKPVVAFHVSSNPEVVDHGHTGLLAEQENVEDLVQCVKELIHNEDLRKTLGQNARKRVEEQFEIQRVVDETLALINTN
jgi:glycosyltransferase involved in cell wall biosynthesis